jgi:diacylglycerol O-acyltransferase / wax synthase
VQRLTAFDAGFLYMETPSLHMHTLKISILDPSTIPDGYRFERVREVLAERLHLLPPFRRRLVPIPFSLHHPVWIEDPEFDLDRHLHRVEVRAPGGMREFSELCSDSASRQLDRRQPLWELWVVEGLEHGHVGFVAKIHHAAADGVAAAGMLASVLDASPDAAAPAAPAAPWRPDRVPTRGELVRGALTAWVRVIAGLPALLRRTMRGLRAVVRRRRASSVSPPIPLVHTPKTSFNRALTANRSFVMTSMSLDEVKRVKSAFGVTVNDVVLGICAGGLRRYLERRGELPDRPLVAGVPVSARGATADADDGEYRANVVSNMFTSLRTDLIDPVARLHAIHDVTGAAKEVHNALGADMLMEWVEFTPPGPFAAWMRLYSRLRLADRHRPAINLVVSNVPGPRDPLYIAGARLTAIYSMGPILEGIGLNVTVWSYLDQLGFGIVACPETMPDLWDFVDDLHDALDELSKLAA